MATITPHPFNIGERDDNYDVADSLFDLDSMWFVCLRAAVPMVLALPSGGAAMFTRSTPGCGTPEGPSLAWAASL